MNGADLSGLTELTAGDFIDITDSLCLTAPYARLPHTQLTAVNLQACSWIDTFSLHHLLKHSPSLQRLNLRGLKAATNTTCDVIAAYNTHLTHLDFCRCPEVDGDGIRSFSIYALARKEHLLLKELNLSGIRHIDDRVMTKLGRAAPYLEVLDLSSIRQLHNSALEAFVACDDMDDEEVLGVPIIQLTARQVGRDQNDSGYYRRRVTRLRHLSLSACILLTDNACSNLAHSVPKLEFLELASIGPDLRDDGLSTLR